MPKTSEPKNYKIRYGSNLWLLTDDHRTVVHYVGDRCLASVHTLSWARQFQDDMRRQDRNVDILTLDEIEATAAREREDQLRMAWFHKFQNAVEDTYEPTYSREGFWANANLLHHHGLSVAEAVEQIGDGDHLRLTRRVLTLTPVLTLDRGVVTDSGGSVLGEFEGDHFVPSLALLGMDARMHRQVEDAAYALPDAPRRPINPD